MGGLNTKKLGGSGSNTLFSAVRIVLYFITATAVGIFILICSSFSAGPPTIGLQVALEECLGQNKVPPPHDLHRDSPPTETMAPNLSEEKNEEKSGRVLGNVVGGGGQVACLQHDVCGMGEDELAAALRLPHGTRKEKDRYFYDGTWLNFWTFFTNARKVEDGPRVVCVVVHVEGQMPCRDSPGGCVLHFHVRPNDTDMLVVEQLIEREDLEGLDPHAEYEAILDAGGNCGIASVLFATQESKLVLFGGKSSSWDMEVKEVKKGEDMPTNAVATLDGISIPYLLRLSGLDHFDFMKVDIEGSELQVFDKTDERVDLSFLEKVRVVVCEVHEHMRQGSRASVMNAFSSGFDQTMTGEYVMFTRRQG